jgi:hypothetical protein
MNHSELAFRALLLMSIVAIAVWSGIFYQFVIQFR